MKRLWIILLAILTSHCCNGTLSAQEFEWVDDGCSSCVGGSDRQGSGGYFDDWQPRLPSIMRHRGADPMGPLMSAAAGPLQGMSPYGGGPSPGVWSNGGSGYQNLGGTCSGPSWWDFRAEAVFMMREQNGSMPIMSDGIRGFGPPNTVLSTGAPDFNYEPAFRVSGRFQLSALTSIEAEYLGGLDWDDRVTRFGNSNNLYSAFSDFGNTPFGGYEDTDQASVTSLNYDAELDVAELNSRRAWTTCSAKTHGSWLYGIRYARIDESLLQQIDVFPHFDPINMIDRDAAFTDYDIRVKNDLFGLQIGSEMTHALWPGFLISAEVKGGVYANRAEMNSLIVSSTLPGGLRESETDTSVAFASNSRVYLLWQFHPMWKLKTGYEILFFDNVATAAGNYNASPFLPTDPVGNPVIVPPRETRLNDHDDLFYHGFHVGLEFGW